MKLIFAYLNKNYFLSSEPEGLLLCTQEQLGPEPTESNP
jgi:hypothetical protein